MRTRIAFIIFLTVALLKCSSAFGQSSVFNHSPGTKIFDELATTRLGEGRVTIRQSDAVRSLVGSRIQGGSMVTENGQTYLIMDGYRVQVFSSNNQRQSKQEAEEKEKKVNETFPDLKTYKTYDAPFWRVRVGDYHSYEEAHEALRQLKAAFPAFAKEMYIVGNEKIKIRLY